MTETVAAVMRHVRNHFVSGRVSGHWQLEEGRLIPGDRIAPGTWVALPCPFGPAGIHQLDENGCIPGGASASWEGDIWLLTPPEDFLALCAEIHQWRACHRDPAMTGEKFSQYSRQLRDSRWQTAFDAALAPYRRMYPEVM